MIQFLEKLRSTIKDKSEAYSRRVISGNLKDYEEYRYLCGMLCAFKEIDGIVLETHRQLLEAADSMNMIQERNDG